MEGGSDGMLWISIVKPALMVCLALIYLFLLVWIIRLRGELHISGLKDGLRHLWGKKGRLTVLAVLFLLAAFGAQMAVGIWSPNMLMVFSYEEAARGQNPNATRFNESEILSDRILEKVIKRGSLEITPEQLSECLSLSTPLDEQDGQKLDVSTESDLKISTEHWVHCSGWVSLYRIDPKTVLSLLADVYWEDFIQSYAENDNILDLSLDRVDDLEYLDRKEFLNMQANKLRNYLPSYSNESASFRTQKDQETFSSLSGKIAHFIDIDLERYEAFILENGLSQDRSAYRSRMEYVNHNLQVSRDKDMMAHDVRLEAINMYNAFMSRFVLIPTYDTDQEFYMSRTKVGVDYFADEAKEYLAKATDLVEKMDHNTYAVSQLELSTAGADTYAEADRQTEKLKEELLHLASQCRALCDEYVKEKRNGYIQIGFTDPAVMDVALDSLLLTALFAAACACLFILEPVLLEKRRKTVQLAVEHWTNATKNKRKEQPNEEENL